MIKRILIALVLGLTGAQAHSSGYYFSEDFFTTTWDNVSKGNLEIDMPNAESVLLSTVEDVKGTFELYEPKIGKGVKVLQPLRVTGSRENPRLHMRIQKCVAIFCQDADLDADVRLLPATGTCKYNWIIDMDIRNSSSMIVDQYDRLQIHACYQARTDRQGNLVLDGKIRRGARYSPGTIQASILDVLKSQFEPMSQALRKNMRKHAGNPDVRLILKHQMLK